MTMINAQSASNPIAAAAEKPRPQAATGDSAEAVAAQKAPAGGAVPEGLVQSARYRLMREANTLSAESAMADAAMARDLTDSVRGMILDRASDSVRIQSGALPHDALRLLD